MYFGSKEKTKKDICLETTATLLFSAFKSNDKFGAYIFNNNKAEFIPLKKGKGHLVRILQTLIQFFEDNNTEEEQEKSEINHKKIQNVLKSKNLCFFISDDIQKSFTDKEIKILTRKHDFIFIHSFDPFEYGEIPSHGLFYFMDSESGKEAFIDFSEEKIRNKFQVLRKQRKEKSDNFLKKNRIDQIEISTDDEVFSQLLKFFKLRQLRF